MLEHHGIFQGYYFFQLPGPGTATCATSSAAIPAFERTAQFCHLYDQNSFDPTYDSMPLDAFVPMMRRVMDDAEALDLPQAGRGLTGCWRAGSLHCRRC